MQEANRQAAFELNRWQMPALIIGIVALIVCVVFWFFNHDQFFHSYLLAYLFWVGLTLGCLGILMMQYLTGGGWGIILRRALESATRTLPLLLILFVPLLFGLHRLYIWTNQAAVNSDPLLKHKSAFLNIPFFLIRVCIYFILWLGLALALNRWSRAQDETAAPELALKMQRLSGPGLFFLCITLSLALIDWIMSIEPRWFSTIYAVGFLAGEALAGYAFIIIIIALLAPYPPLNAVITTKHFRDLGNLLLTFVMLWAYCAFAQYLLIWSGNLREEIPWYLRRTVGGWGWLAIALILFHFFLPFFMLLSRRLKDNPRTLALIAGIVIVMRFVDVYWLVEPAFSPAHFEFHLMDIVATIGIGGVWLWVFVWQLKKRPLLPLHDPYAKETFSGE